MNQFKRAQVVMLEAHYSKTTKYETEGTIELFSNKLSITGKVKPSQHPFVRGSSKQQHLYIISNDEIKEGDYWINLDRSDINSGSLYDIANTAPSCKKIIATTDTSLKIFGGRGDICDLYYNLPQPSQQFIEKYIESYNKGEIITDVLVEYEEFFNSDVITRQTVNSTGLVVNDVEIKVNPKDNTITIKKLKDSWNREEIIELLKLAWKESDSQYDQDDWVFNGEDEINITTYFEKDMDKWINKIL